MISYKCVIFLVALCAVASGHFNYHHDQSSYLSRLQSIAQAVDADENGIITKTEFADSLRRNDDLDKDGCVTLEEWTRGFKKVGFTNAFAGTLFNGLSEIFQDPVSTCGGVDVASVRQNSGNFEQTIEDFLDSLVQGLIDLCEAEHILYATNRDCMSLPFLCKSDSFACRDTCRTYMFVTSAGRGEPFGALSETSINFATRVQAYLKATDLDEDGIVMEQEMKADLVTNFDVNNDSCVDLMEIKFRLVLKQCGGLGFTQEFAVAFYNEFKGATKTCDGIGTAAVNASLGNSTNDFRSKIVQILVDMCEENLDLYETNVDCLSLPSACRYFDIGSLNVCKQYLAKIGGRKYSPFLESRQRYRDFFSGLGRYLMPR